MADLLTNVIVETIASVRLRFFNPTKQWPSCRVSASASPTTS